MTTTICYFNNQSHYCSAFVNDHVGILYGNCQNFMVIYTGLQQFLQEFSYCWDGRTLLCNSIFCCWVRRVGTSLSFTMHHLLPQTLIKEFYDDDVVML